MTNSTTPHTVPRASLKRLPLYLHLLENLMADGVEYVSCTQLAKEFDFDAILVRKDIELTGEVGTARIGFKVATLIGSIKSFLGWDKEQDAFLVGVGNLGKAILGYKDFKKYGLNIVAAFDNDSRKVGTKVFGYEIFSTSKFGDLAKRMHIYVGIITVPPEHAQEAVDLMVDAGIKAIWNFSPAPLRIPEGVILENVRLTQSLAVLTNKLKRVFKS
ncbi:MAG: redox-sensing transcriptional repressor Rex [Candidatus Omnitrophica bacterium]|nr:redox-sensing transcriptional repressor Rex [Candidatus Omnitrophota bacterium]